WGFLGAIALILIIFLSVGVYTLVTSKIHGKKYAYVPPEEMNETWERYFHSKFSPINSMLVKVTEDAFIYQSSNDDHSSDNHHVSRRGMADLYQQYVEESSVDRGLHRYDRDEILDPLRSVLKGQNDHEIPFLSVDDEGVLHIKTTEGEKLVELDDPISDAYLLDVVGDVFRLSVSTEEFDHYVYMLTMDFTTEYVLETKSLPLRYEDDAVIAEALEEFTKFYHDDRFEVFTDLYPQVEGEETYLLYNDQELYDTEQEEFIMFDEDLLSSDGKFVYLGVGDATITASTIDEGEQYVQSLSDYLAGDNEYVVSFTLDYSSIAKALKQYSPGSSYQEITYFNDSLIIFDLSYRALYFGKLGDIILALDFSGEKAELIILDMLDI